MSHTEQYIEAQAAANELVDVPQLVTYIIQDGLDHAASDIHIEPWEDMTGVRVRVNGVLQWVVGIPSDFHENICGRFKVMANMKSHVKDLPQDGKAAPPEFKGVQLRTVMVILLLQLGPEIKIISLQERHIFKHRILGLSFLEYIVGLMELI